MSERMNKIIHSFEIVFWILVAGILLTFFIGEIRIPGVDSGLNYQCQLLPVEWKRVWEDGTRTEVKVPGSYPVLKGERVTIEAILPEDLKEMPWLCFRSSQQDMEIYIDGNLRQVYTTEGTRLFGKNSMSAYVFVKLIPEDAAKNIQVVTMSNSTFSGFLNEVYWGDSFGIWKHFFEFYGAEMITAILIMVLGIVCIIFCRVLRVKYKKVISQEYLGWGMFLTAFWVFSESRLRQLLFQNISVAGNIAFLVGMILPLPFMIYANYIQNSRYWKAYVAGMALTLGNFVLCVGMQLSGQRDFLENMPLIYLVLGVAILIMAVTIVKDIKNGDIREYFLVAIGLCGLTFAAIIEMGAIYFKILSFTGIPLSTGLLFLLIMASIKTGQDIFTMERENEHAIAIGETKMGFLANMSHEIRTPINTVIGMNEMILRENADDNIRKYAGEIHKAGNLLLAMINEMLDFSKLSGGTLELEQTPYYLASLLNDVLHDINRKAEEKNLEVVLNIDEKLPSRLQGDEIRIKQVLNHLISNAVKYTQRGRITFTIQGKWTEQGEFWLVMSIADTGMGIKQEDLGKLYESFVRMEEKKNRAIEGTGLGLNISKQLVDMMQGEISVQSVYGKGSIFTVKIPQKVLNGEPIGDLQAAYDREVDGIRNYRELFRAPQAHVLAVDDNQMNLTVVKSLLKKTEMQLELCSGGAQALEFAKRKKYDLILLDHMMPEPDGVQVLHKLKEKEDNLNYNTPVIVLTANAVAGIKEWYLQQGFDDYLSKPIAAEKLEHMIKTYLPQELIKVELVTPEGKEQESSEACANENALAKEGGIQNSSLINPSVGMGYCMDDEELYLDVLQTYYEQGQSYREKLQELYGQRDWKGAAVIIHAIKSTSLNIGAVEMSEKAKILEQYAKDGEQEQIQSQWELFMELYHSVLEQAARLLKESSSDVSKQFEETGALNELQLVSKEEYLLACEELLEYIRAYSMQEAMEQLERLRGMEFSKDRQSAMEMLDEVLSAVDGFAYDEAEELVEQWIVSNR